LVHPSLGGMKFLNWAASGSQQTSSPATAHKSVWSSASQAPLLSTSSFKPHEVFTASVPKSSCHEQQIRKENPLATDPVSAQAHVLHHAPEPRHENHKLRLSTNKIAKILPSQWQKTLLRHKIYNDRWKGKEYFHLKYSQKFKRKEEKQTKPVQVSTFCKCVTGSSNDISKLWAFPVRTAKHYQLQLLRIHFFYRSSCKSHRRSRTRAAT